MLLFGIFFSGLVGGFIGGLVAGLLARGISRGLAASFFGGVFGASLIALIELFGFILFDETFMGRFFGFSDVFVGVIIILAFFGILSSVLGGFVGGFFAGLLRRS
jgi:hypothetical protein